MARRQVVEIDCSRCDRTELREPFSTLPTSENSKALVVRMADGTEIDFEDLCAPCMGAVKGHLEAIGKKITGLSPERKKKEPVAKKKSPTPLQGLTPLRTSGHSHSGE